jgi:hypothetical protein
MWMPASFSHSEWRGSRVRWPRVFAALALAFSLGASLANATEEDPEPAAPGTRSLYLLYVPFLHFGPLETSTPSPHALAFDVEIAYANTFSNTWHAEAIHSEFHLNGLPFSREEAETLHERHPQDVIAFIDGEVTRVALRGAYAFSEHLSAALEIPWISFSALDLDGAIESFHRAFGLFNQRRPDFPRGQFEIVRQRAFGRLEFDDRRPSAGLGDMTASLRYRNRLGAFLVSADLVGKLPTGDANEYRGSGSADGGLLVGALYRFGATKQWELRAEGGVVVPGTFRGNTPTTFEVTTFLRFLAAADVRLGRRTFVALAVTAEQSPFRHDALGDGAGTAVDVTLGLSRRLGEHMLANLAVIENVPRYGDAADVTISLGLKLAP